MASGTTTGTTSQNGSKYDWYISYSYTFDTSSMKWTVTCKAYLRVKYYAYEGPTSHSLSIGGDTRSSKSNYSKACYSNNGVKTFLFATGTKTYAASTSARSVKLVAKASANSGGYGPGTCVVSKTITLPAKLSSSGTLSVSGIAATSCRLNLTKLSTSLGYTRTVKFFKKLSTASTWSLIDTVKVAASASSVSKNATGLLSGKEYDFKACVYAPNGKLMRTATQSKVAILKDAFTLTVEDKTQDTINLKIDGLLTGVGYTRVLKGYYKKSTDTTWTALSKTISLASSGAVDNLIMSFTGLSKDVSYDFYVDCLYGSTNLYKATLSNITIASSEFLTCELGELKADSESHIVSAEVLMYEAVTDASRVACYAKEMEGVYYHIDTVDYSTEMDRIQLSIPNTEEIQDIFTDAFQFKLFFLNNNIIVNIFILRKEYSDGE